ncbi:MAG TPA: SDR family oxidoreductase [Acidimicrobiia bacterium]|nr:SDR family oxidoreductase [Acidimicrobiia bacterium]
MTPDLTGKTVLVTGGNTGIGKEAGVGLASMGAHLVFTSRDPQRGEAARREIAERSGNDAVDVMGVDLADLSSIGTFARAFLDRYERLDVLVANAGGTWSQRRTTADGFEMTFGVNHLGHFELVRLLLDRLKESAPSRIVVTASGAHRGARRGIRWDDLDRTARRYRGMRVYNESKLANILFTRELARRLEGTGVTANCFHPGFVATEFGHGGDTRLLAVGTRLGRPFARNATKGADTAVWLASAPELDGVTGGYFFDRKLGRLSKWGRDDEAARRLWDLSERLLDEAKGAQRETA